jgi:hypothetical protein
LVSKRQCQVLRRWLRHAKKFIDIEEKTIYICELEVGEKINEEEKIPVKDLIDYQECIYEVSHCQEGNEDRSSRDLIDCQVGRGGNAYF